MGRVRPRASRHHRPRQGRCVFGPKIDRRRTRRASRCINIKVYVVNASLCVRVSSYPTPTLVCILERKRASSTGRAGARAFALREKISCVTHIPLEEAHREVSLQTLSVLIETRAHLFSLRFFQYNAYESDSDCSGKCFLSRLNQTRKMV